MRPLAPHPQVVEGPSLPETVAATRGSYCAMCERPLISEGLVWDAATGSTVVPYGPGAPVIDDALLVCGDCERAQALAGRFEAHELALPNRDVTFQLGGQSLFLYDIVDVEVVLEDDHGVESTREELVVVQPTTDAAEATVTVFRLNGEGWIGDRVVLRRDKRLAQADIRARLRTEAWRRASRLAERIRLEGALSPRDRVRAHEVIAASGFPSVWATVLADMAEPDLLGRLFGMLPEDPAAVESLGPAMMAMVAGTPFPGTDPRWLFPHGGPVTGRPAFG